MIAPPITETAFLSQVLELAALLGYEGAHFRPALTQKGWRTPVQGSLGKGWPDLVLVRGSRILFVELKTDKGTVSPDQHRVLEVLEATGAYVNVWTPSMFDRIVEDLR